MVTAESAPCLMLVAGEASGDLHGATLSRALRREAPGWRLLGMGGPRMAEAGVRLLDNPIGHAVVGGSEALSRVPRLFRAFRRLSKEMRATRPRALILIDFPEFNLRLARVAKRREIPVIYFIPPQVWAWRRWRARLLARLATEVLAVFPFEPPIYEAAGARVQFVGHPLLDVLPNRLSREGARPTLGIPADATLIGLLPGSRREEVERLLPSMAEAARQISEKIPQARFLLALAPTVEPAWVERVLREVSLNLAQVRGRTYEVMAAADLLLVASGTATLEAALIGTPMVVCYRVSRLSELIARRLIRVPWVSLPNIVSGRAVVPELLQENATGPRLAEEALGLLGNPERLRAQRLALGDLKGALGSPGVGERVARRILELAGSPHSAPSGTARSS
ncbi:MAG: lipid-A-disaccharide synthase [Candidatus Rokubacteria bacterium]|nr:lipid-A-disaccharide synthase [Candidatus Rokubacteria bacterium]